MAVSGLVAVGLYRRSPSHRATVQERLARIYIGMGRLEDAAEALGKAIALEPDRADDRIGLARVLHELHRPAEAEALLRQGLTLTPGDRRLTVALAAHLIAARRSPEAFALLEPRLDELRAVSEPRERTEGLITAGRAASDSERARAIFEEAARTQDPEARATALAALGELEVRQDHVEEALAAFRAAHEAAPAWTWATVYLAELLDRSGRSDEATDLLLALMRSGAADRLDAAPGLTHLLLGAGRVRDAQVLADSVTTEPGGFAFAPFVHGTIALAQGEPARAEAEFAQMESFFPRTPRAPLLRARAALRAGFLDRSEAAFKRALAIDPGNAEAELGLLLLDERAGAVAAVESRATRLLARPETHARALVALLGIGNRKALRAEAERLAASETPLAEVLERAHAGSSDALEALELVVSLARDPAIADVRLPLARNLARAGRRDLARRLLEAALEAAPDDAAARLAWARVLAAVGERERAFAELDKLAAARPDDLEVQDALADVSLELDRTRTAIDALEKVARSGTALSRARLARARLLAGDGRAALADFEAARSLDPKLPAARGDALWLLAQGDTAAAARALQRAYAETGEARFGAAFSALSAVEGKPEPEPFRAWRRTTPLAEAELVAPLVEERSLTPPQRRVLELFALGVAGGTREVERETRRVARDGGDPQVARFLLGAVPEPAVCAALARLALKAGPDLPAGGDLAAAIGALGDREGQTNLLTELSVRFPRSAEVAVRLGAALRRSNRDAAIAEYRRATELDPESVVAHNNLACVLGEFASTRPAATEEARKAFRLAPVSGEVCDTLGWLLEQNGQFGEAEVKLARAAVFSPGDPTIRRHLGETLAAKGELGRARHHLRFALERGLPVADVAKARELLAKLDGS